MLAARAASRSFLTVATVARQRGRTPQLLFIMSRTSSAVVFGSMLTGLSSGAGGSLALAHWLMMSVELVMVRSLFPGRRFGSAKSQPAARSPDEGKRIRSMRARDFPLGLPAPT